MMAGKLNVSLDYLMFGTDAPGQNEEPEETLSARTTLEGITITSADPAVIAAVSAVRVANIMWSKKGDPKFILYGINKADGNSIWGPNNTVLGFYAVKEDVEKEIWAISDAMSKGNPSYTLKFNMPYE